MGFYRMIDRSLWGDERIQECSPYAKAIFVYLTANDHDDVSGVYRLSVGMIEEDTGWNADVIRSALGELAAQDLAHYDERRRVIWVVNMFRKQAQSTRGLISKSLLEHAGRQLESLPRTVLKSMMVAYYRDAHGIDIPADLSSEERTPSPTGVPTPPQQGCPGVGGTGGHPPVSVSVSVSVSDPVSVSEGGVGGGGKTPAAKRRGKSDERPTGHAHDNPPTSDAVASEQVDWCTGATRTEKRDTGPPAKRPSAAREANAELVAQANAVLDRLNEHRAALAEKHKLDKLPKFGPSKTNRQEILRLLDEGEPLQNLLDALDAAAQEIDHKRGEDIEWLNAVTPFRASNWPRTLARVGAPRNRGSPRSSGRYEITGAEDYGEPGQEFKL